jgi:quinol monooxygenase YgiN
MSIEYIRFRIQKDLHDDFIKAVGDAHTILNAYTNCLRYEISRC